MKKPKLRIPISDRAPKVMIKSKKDSNRSDRRKMRQNGFEEE